MQLQGQASPQDAQGIISGFSAPAKGNKGFMDRRAGFGEAVTRIPDEGMWSFYVSKKNDALQIRYQKMVMLRLAAG